MVHSVEITSCPVATFVFNKLCKVDRVFSERVLRLMIAQESWRQSFLLIPKIFINYTTICMILKVDAVKSKMDLLFFGGFGGAVKNAQPLLWVYNFSSSTEFVSSRTASLELFQGASLPRP